MSEKILVTRSSMPELEEYIDEIKELWDSHWLTNMGVKHQQLQKQLKDYLNVEYVELLTNGHMALEVAFQALGLKGEVITTPFTFASTTHAIVRSGLTPVFCDINAEDFTIDVTKIEELITEKTCAIVPVHVYGNICDVDEIEKIANRHNLKVIYDAAHTFGVKYGGKGIGAYGDASCFSFHATKVFNTIEGGAICFKNGSFGDDIQCMKNFGIRKEDVINSVGTNAKMNEFCAAMGICNLKHIDEQIHKRKEIVEKYRTRLKNVNGLILNPIQEKVDSNYSYFPVVFVEELFGSNREVIINTLAKHGISARKYFYPLTNMFDCYNGFYANHPTPIALKISESVITLPLYADLELEKVDLICDIILSCKKTI